MFNVGVASSGDPDSDRAAAQAVGKAILRLGMEPKAIFLYATDNYCKSKEDRNNLLTSAANAVGSNIPLVGGTVTGFVCPDGCFSRGVVAVAFGGSNLEVMPVFVNEMRFNTVEKAKRYGNELGKKLRALPGKNKLVMEVTPGPTEPQVFSNPNVESISQNIPFWAFSRIRDFLFDVSVGLDYAQAMEEDFLNALSGGINEVLVAGLSSFDGTKALRNYQFYGGHSFVSAFVGLGFSLDNEIILKRDLPLNFSGIHIDAEKGYHNFCIDKIDGLPAVDGYLKAMNWPKSFKKSHISEIFEKTFYYPLSFREGERVYAFPAGMFIGKSIGVNRHIRSRDVEVCYSSANLLFKSVGSYLDLIKSKPVAFSFFTGGAHVPSFLGSKLYSLKDLIEEKIPGLPYVFLFGAGEHSKFKNEAPFFNNFSLVMLSIRK
ncbi:MAG: hypothetical protein GOV15_04880 [Candidatus Diapherotrites archaeon]|nr:hypothetical protein [Candidatus Diapherotrites archaeon]